MMDYWSSIEIDCEEDLQICDKILTQRALQNNINRLPDKVGLLALDFDGVFTDNKVIINENGIESVIVDRGDGMGIASIKKLGIPIAVISTEHNSVVRARCKKLDIECIQGIDDKVKVFQKYISDKHIDPDSTIYVGNDINDIDCIKAAKCGVAVANAHAMLKEIADITLSHSGGSGAIREICDLIIRKMDNG
jgi:N-acylneuraminate cytidylyltransferase